MLAVRRWRSKAVVGIRQWTLKRIWIRHSGNVLISHVSVHRGGAASLNIQFAFYIGSNREFRNVLFRLQSSWGFCEMQICLYNDLYHESMVISGVGTATWSGTVRFSIAAEWERGRERESEYFKLTRLSPCRIPISLGICPATAHTPSYVLSHALLTQLHVLLNNVCTIKRRGAISSSQTAILLLIALSYRQEIRSGSSHTLPACLRNRQHSCSSSTDDLRSLRKSELCCLWWILKVWALRSVCTNPI